MFQCEKMSTRGDITKKWGRISPGTFRVKRYILGCGVSQDVKPYHSLWKTFFFFNIVYHSTKSLTTDDMLALVYLVIALMVINRMRDPCFRLPNQSTNQNPAVIVDLMSHGNLTKTGIKDNIVLNSSMFTIGLTKLHKLTSNLKKSVNRFQILVIPSTTVAVNFHVQLSHFCVTLPRSPQCSWMLST